MDEKTEELRDLFIDTTGADTVTEGQEETPGSLTDRDDTAVAERLAELVETMREQYEFGSQLDDEAHVTVVRQFFEGDSDAEIAEAIAADLDVTVDADVVFKARMDLHLVHEDDRDAPFDLDALKRHHAENVPVEERAGQLNADEETVRHYTEVVETDLESTRANDRFRDEFRDLLTDADIEGSLARDAREDGLREATEDIETDVSL